MNSKISKRFKKKMKNFRQGMTAWFVNGWPIRDENYHDWASDQEYLDRSYGKGNATCLNDGSGWYFIYCQKRCNVPVKERGVTMWYGGKRRTHTFKSFTSMQGCHGDRVFKKQSQAQAFMMEIVKGNHNAEISGSRYFHSEMDHLDDMLIEMNNITEIDETDYRTHESHDSLY